jgi:hypothetical protein
MNEMIAISNLRFMNSSDNPLFNDDHEVGWLLQWAWHGRNLSSEEHPRHQQQQLMASGWW